MKPKILFVYDHKYENMWRDGLWAALNLLKEDYEVQFHNLKNASPVSVFEGVTFVLGWGGFHSPVDHFIQKLKDRMPDIKYGLCIGGNAFPPSEPIIYDVLFYETDWAKKWLIDYAPNIEEETKLVHAFGINGDIYSPWTEAPIIWDWLSVGAFAYWKRHERILTKSGTRLVIGEIQKDNWQESFDIISDLLLNGVSVSDMLYPTKLRNIYNCSGTIYIPADINGGGERAVLEARACGRPVEIEDDNAKLKELLSSPIWDHVYYANQLKKGLKYCLE